MICAVCEKCNLASCRYRWYGDYVMNGKSYEKLEFKCSKCGQLLFKHVTTEEYNEDRKNKRGDY